MGLTLNISGKDYRLEAVTRGEYRDCLRMRAKELIWASALEAIKVCGASDEKVVNQIRLDALRDMKWPLSCEIRYDERLLAYWLWLCLREHQPEITQENAEALAATFKPVALFLILDNLNVPENQSANPTSPPSGGTMTGEAKPK